MRPLLFIVPALVPLAGMMPGPSHADPYAWCAQYPEHAGGGRNCGFVSLGQCQATVSGTGGFCQPNPRYTGARPVRRHRDRD
jgi:hypothetical protein